MKRLIVILSFVAALAVARAELSVSMDFEGGSARVLAIDQITHTIRFMPGGDPVRGWPCWWFLRVDGADPGETLSFEITGSDRVIPQAGENLGRPLSVGWATPVRAAVSADGREWQHTEPGEKRTNGMVWRVPAKGASVWLAWGPPFTPHDSAALVARLVAEHPFATAFTLARTREGRDVPALRISAGELPANRRSGVWVEARQHAWESGSSWVCRGFAEWVVSDDEAARWLREHAEIYIVPVMDVDHVATGDGGKEALPQDHNRDWSAAPHWPEVAAAQERLSALARERRMDVFLDLHNPGPGDLGSYFYTGEDSLLTDLGKSGRERFLGLAREHLTGPVPYDPKTRASGVTYHPLWRQMSNNWVISHGLPHTLSLCLETAWNTPASTTEGYRATGRQLGSTIAEWLRGGSAALSK
jgi:hypothetical protein